MASLSGFDDESIASDFTDLTAGSKTMPKSRYSEAHALFLLQIHSMEDNIGEMFLTGLGS